MSWGGAWRGAGRGLLLILPQGSIEAPGRRAVASESRQRCSAPLRLEGSTRKLHHPSGGDHRDHQALRVGSMITVTYAELMSAGNMAANFTRRSVARKGVQ
jgi:hypothetical protein